MRGQELIVILSQGGEAVASTSIRSQDIRSHCDAIEKASVTQQDWTEVVAGRKSWKIDISYLVMAAGRIRDLLLVGQMFDVTIKDKDNTQSVTGTAMLTDVGNVAAFGNLAQGSMSLIGSGALE